MNFFDGYIGGEKPVVADFIAGWSEPCKLMDPVLLELKEQLGDNANIVRIDIEKEPSCAELFKIWSVPTVIIFKKGHEVWRKTGIIPAHEILTNLNYYIR